jgi:hypothetical protein
VEVSERRMDDADSLQKVTKLFTERCGELPRALLALG